MTLALGTPDTPRIRVLASILPAVVAVAEATDAGINSMLLPAEAAFIAHAVERRRREFAAVRSCARSCLRQLGLPASAILPGPAGAPSWPPGARGSMTHCPGYAAAAVGTAEHVLSLGIDAEPDEPLPDGVLDVVATPAERGRMAAQGPAPRDPCWDRLLFSAKESVYKAWQPQVGGWLDPLEADVRFGPGPGTFTAELSRDDLLLDGRPVTRLAGRWAREAGILVTAVVLIAPGSTARDRFPANTMRE